MKRILMTRLTTLAANQGGHVNVAQARQLGCSMDQLRRAVQAGHLEKVYPQVLRVCGAPPAGRSDLWAAVLQHWPAGVASHQSPLHLLGVNGAPPGNAITIGPRSNWPCAGIELHRFADLRPRHRTTIDGLPCTTVARCLVDLTSTVHPTRLRHLLDEVVVTRRMIGYHEVARVLAEVNPRGRRNLTNIATLLDERAAGTPTPRSTLEARLDAVLASIGLTGALHEYPLPTDGSMEGFVDRAFPEAMLIAELDGRRWHARMEAMARDRRRDRIATRHGWATVRVLDEELVSDEAGVGAEILAAYRTRCKQLRTA
jgi:very-short-patch-repair endonuclease